MKSAVGTKQLLENKEKENKQTNSGAIPEAAESVGGWEHLQLLQRTHVGLPAPYMAGHNPWLTPTLMWCTVIHINKFNAQ